MAAHRCVYTVVIGGFEELLDQPVAAESDIDFICFSDDPGPESTTWTIRRLSALFPEDGARSSRWPKINAHRVLPEYEESLYIDASVRLRQPPEVIFEDLLPQGIGIAAMAHSYRSTVEDEFAAVAAGDQLEAPWILAEQLAHYRAHYPDALVQRPLNGGFLLRRHQRIDVAAAMELWFHHVLRYSRRDQLSFRIALEQAKLHPSVLELDIRDNEYCEWPVRLGRERSRRGDLPVIPELDERIAEANLARAATADAEAKLQTVNRRLADAERQISELNVANAKAAERLASVFSSTSWNITRPIRWVGRWTHGG